MVSKQQTKKPLTRLMLRVCFRAALIRECYRFSSWDTDKDKKVQINKDISTCSVNKMKKSSELSNKVKRNIPHIPLAIEKSAALSETNSHADKTNAQKTNGKN